MQDINAIRERTDEVRASIQARHKDVLPLVDKALSLDAEWRRVKGDLDELRHDRNTVSAAINTAKKEGKDAKDLLKKAKEIPALLKALEEKESGLREELDKTLKAIPNFLDPQTPIGESEKDNVVKETHGGTPMPDFEPKSHVEICEELGIADFDAARRTSGNGFFFLKGDLALLDQALQRYALDIMVGEGFTPVVPPYMIRRDIVDGVVDIAFFEESIYKIEDEDAYLIGTSEHPLVGMLTGQDVDSRELPITLCGISPCFRRELGAHGIDEKGLFRTHQFQKIEQIVVCHPEQSDEWFDKLLDITKKIFTGLELPWHELVMCSGDLGDLKTRQSDLEVWSPRRQGYFEVGSCSNLTDAQARRLNIRIVHPDGQREYAHTLNNTALATSRAMVAILENHQRADGTVTIPKVLRPYMGNKSVLGKA